MKKPNSILRGHLSFVALALMIVMITGALFVSCSDKNPVGPEPPDPPDPPTHPDKVTLTVTPKDKDSVADDAVISIDSDSIGTGKIEKTLPYSKTAVTFCADGPYFKEQVCKDVIPDRDQTVTLQLEREQVTLKVSLDFEGSEFEVVPSQVKIVLDDKVIEPLGDSYYHVTSYTTGAQAGTRKLAVIYGRAKASQTIPADQDVATTLKVPDFPNCSDGLDNDQDGQADEKETGCATDAGIEMVDGKPTFTHDPDDDNEVVKHHTTSFIAPYSNQNFFITNKQGHRKIVLLETTGSLADNVSLSIANEVQLGVRVLLTSDNNNEDIKVVVATGNNYSKTFSFKVMDDGSQGWTMIHDHIPNDFFANSREIKITLIFIGNGEAKIKIIDKTDQGQTLAQVTWDYEPEDVPNSAGAYIARPDNTRVGNYRVKTVPKARDFKGFR